jgi:hypothetical protein
LNNLPNKKISLDMIIGKNRGYADNYDVANEIASGLLNTPEDWKIFDPNAPYSYAFCIEEGKCMIPSPGMREDFWNLNDTSTNSEGNYNFSTDITNMYYKQENSYIITYNQYKYWYQP